MTSSETPLRAQTGNLCVVCGPGHPHGLRLRFEIAPSGDASAPWTPTADWEGFRGVIHGGIVSTVLDEAMSKAVAALPAEAFTAELRVRFRRHVASGSPYLIRGWVVERRKRHITAEAALTTPDGVEHAHAWATFLAPAPSPSYTSFSGE
ncbi:MAG: PaaI family thioesterase [Acidobacteria bacterium]|nr:PaaI family thioesterase [Acidobacteriota bacterium]